MREAHILQRLLLPGLLLLIPSIAAAQNANDVISLFRGLAQTAIVQSTLFEWQKLPKDELACIDGTLISRGDSLQGLIQQGVQPTDRRVADLRASCVRQPTQRVANGDGQSVYVVDGLRLGGMVQQDSSTYREYRCGPSEQFSGFTWCQKKADERTARGQFSSSYSILHSQGGNALYINRFLEPAWFSGNEANDDINGRSKKYGAPTRIIPMPKQSSVPNGMIVTWGNVVLEPLDTNNVGQLAIGRDVRAGLMIDHIGNFQRSAQLGLPIYRLTGGAGYVWAASWDQRGVGTLRFLTIDASAIDAQISNGGTKADSGAVADREPVGQAPPAFTQDGSEKIRADALAAENRRLMEAQKAAVEESNRKRIADEESAKLTAQALDNSRQAAEKARVEALQAKQAAEAASTWGALFKSQVERCWNKPPEAPVAIQLEAAFTIRLKRDGTLEGMPAPKGTPATPYLRIYQESALRAIIECQPYNLPVAYFNEWKLFTPVFSEPNSIQGSRAEATVHGPQFEAIRSLVAWIDMSMMTVPDVKEAFSDCQNTLLDAENDVLAKVDAAIQKETSRTTQQQLITLRDHAASVKAVHARAGCLKRLLIPIMLDVNGMGENTQGNQRCCGNMDQIVLMDGGFLIERLRSRLADLTGVGLGQYMAKLSISDQRSEIVLIGNGDTKNCFMTKLFATPNMFGNYGSVTGGMSCHGKLEDALIEIAKEIP